MKMKAPSVENISIWNETVYNLEPNSMRLFNEITQMLGQIEPMQNNNNYKRMWLSVERGTVEDMRFDDLDEAMDYFEVENEADLKKKFLEWYPDEKYWFMLEALHNENCRILRLKRFTICICNEIPDYINSTEYEYVRLLEWIKEALAITLNQAKQGRYLEIVEKELPRNLRYGTISRKELYKRRPTCKESILKDLGIVPSYEIALYRQHEFPNQNVEDFMHFCPEEDEDIADAIEWQPIMPVILRG